MFALHHPRGVLCAQAGHKVNFKKFPMPAKLGSRDFSALCHALQRNRMQVQKLGSLLKSKHTVSVHPAARGRASAHPPCAVLSTIILLIHVNPSEPSRIVGRKSA
jgi:hypothetical protein